ERHDAMSTLAADLEGYLRRYEEPAQPDVLPLPPALPPQRERLREEAETGPAEPLFPSLKARNAPGVKEASVSRLERLDDGPRVPGTPPSSESNVVLLQGLEGTARTSLPPGLRPRQTPEGSQTRAKSERSPVSVQEALRLRDRLIEDPENVT